MTAIRKPTYLDLTILIASMFIWGLVFVGTKIVVPEIGPYWVAAGRSTFGFLIVFPIALMIGLTIPRSFKIWLQILAISILIFTIPVVLISKAVLTLDAGIASLLMGSGPFMALFVGHYMTPDERFTIPKLIAVLCGFCGILLIVGPEALNDFGSGPFWAKVGLLVASASFVTAGFTIRRVELPSLSLTTYCLLLGAVIMVPFSYFVSGPLPSNISSETMSWMAFLGFIGSGVTFIARFYLIQRIGYSMFSMGVNLIPVSGVTLGALILGELITFKSGFALLLVVTGLFIARVGVPLPREERAS